MVRYLTKLRIDEISSVDRGAGEGVKILLMKSDSPQPAQGALLFNDIIKANEESDDDKLTHKLMQMVDAMVKVDPSKTEEQHLYSLLHTAHGRQLSRHLNEISKGEPPMPEVDIAKLLEISEAGLNAQVTARDGETFAKAFSRKYETDIDYRRQWQNLTEVKLSMAVLKTTASLTPTSTDSTEAIKQLNEMAKAEPPRDCRRLFCLGHAATAVSAIMA
jgi:hypothetical protein